MARNEYYSKWLSENMHVLNYIKEDTRELLYSEKAGVYGVFFHVDGYRIATYVGESHEIGVRLKNHMKVWFGNGYSEYWNGFSESEFINGNVKIEFVLLAEEDDLFKRLDLEEKMVEAYIPVLQDDADGRFDKYYKGESVRRDICIIPFKSTRKIAWEHKLKVLRECV